MMQNKANTGEISPLFKRTLFIGTAILMLFATLSGAYASPNQPDNRTVGYIGNDTLLHIWNFYDDYYFDIENDCFGQITNHYEQYWTHNTFGVGYKPNDDWAYFWLDEVCDLDLTVTTDNETYINATWSREFSAGGKKFEAYIMAYLWVNDTEMTLNVELLNTKKVNNPFELGMLWKISDIQINMTPENDTFKISQDGVTINLSLDETLDEFYDNTTGELYMEDGDENLHLAWDSSKPHWVTVESEAGQDNAPVTLFVELGEVAEVGDLLETNFLWHDARCAMNWFATTDPSSSKYCQEHPNAPNCIDDEWYGKAYVNHLCNAPFGCVPAYKWQCKIQMKCDDDPSTWQDAISYSYNNKNCWSPCNYGETCYYPEGDVLLPHGYKTVPIFPLYNKCDFRICRCATNGLSSGIGACPCSWTCSASGTRVDNWNNNHTPTSTIGNMTPMVVYQTNDTITCNYTYYDADGDDEGSLPNEPTSPAVEWYINGAHNASFDNQTSINPENISIGSTIQCRVKVFDEVFVTGNETWTALSISKTMSGYEPAILIFGGLGAVLTLLFFLTKDLDEKHYISKTFFLVASPFVLLTVIAIMQQLSLYNGASSGIISMLNTAFFVVLGVSIFNTAYWLIIHAKNGLESAVDARW